jgi:hypothetical protein
MPVNTRILLRRGAATDWSSQVLYAGEIGFETDTGKFKIGDGTTAWSSLGYASILPSELNELVDDRVSSLLVAGTGVALSYNDGANSLTINTNLVAGSGISISGATISLSDPTIQAADITDFNSAVSGLLSVKDITAGSGISVSSSSGNFTISLNDPTIQVADITDLTASASELNLLDGSVANTVVNGKAVIYGASGEVAASSISTSGNVTVGGNLIVNGNTVTVNSTTVTIDDPIFTLGGDTAPGSDDNKDRGIEFRYYDGSAKVGFFGYDDSTGKFTFIADATNSSEVFSGTTGEIDAKIDWSNVNNKPDPQITVALSGDVSGSGSVTLTDLANGTINITTTLAPDSITLGTDTTGDYVASVAVSGTGLSVSGSGEGASVIVSSNATSSNTNSTIVARDGSGNFSAGTITGDLSGTATNANYIEVDTSSSNVNYVVFVNGSDGNLKPNVNSNLQFDAANNELLGNSSTTPTTKLKYFVIDGGTP